MRKDLKLFPFRISTHHVLQQQDEEKRIEKCDRLNEKLEQTGPITFGFVIKHTFISMGRLVTTHVFWGESSPEEISDKHLKGPKVSAFLAFNAKHDLLGSYCFEENGRTVTINSERYIAILDQFHCSLIQKLTQGRFGLSRMAPGLIQPKHH